MASEKEREAFGYGHGYYAPLGPSAPELQPEMGLDPVMYPTLPAEAVPMSSDAQEAGKGFATGSWIWVLSVSALITCPCLGIAAVVVAFLARASDKKQDIENTYKFIKILKAISYASLAIGLMLTIFLIISLTITLSVLISEINRVTNLVSDGT